MIPITQPFLPPKEEYEALISKLWDTRWIANNGMYVQQLEQKLKEYLNVNSIYFTSNGTLALHLALRTLNITKEVITTPFSFVATSTSILWEKCTPVYVDIQEHTLCIDPSKIEAAITEKTEAILATHAFGIPCDIDKIERIAQKYHLKVIYDGAHAFGVKYKGKSLLQYGDLSIVSFHATKLFHTVEGGGIINNSSEKLNEKIQLLRHFGYKDMDCERVGINAKNSEFHAAMGLCNMKYIEEIISNRKQITNLYDSYLSSIFERPNLNKEVQYNYAYYPIIFKSEKDLLKVKKKLEQNHIQTKRYFYPSLNNLPYLQTKQYCPISEDISKRVLCLPLYHDLQMQEVKRISQFILEELYEMVENF